METAVQHGRKCFTVLGGGIDELVDALGGNLQRFLANDVLACVQSGERWIKVRSRRRADGDDLQLGIGEEFIDVRVCLAAVFCREFFRSLAAQVEDGLEFAASHGDNSFCVKVADHAGSDDSEFHVGKGLGFVTCRCSAERVGEARSEMGVIFSKIYQRMFFAYFSGFFSYFATQGLQQNFTS